MKVLIPVDGSERSHRALEYAIRSLDHSRATQLRLINVQPPVSFARRLRLRAEDIRREQQLEGGKALRHAQAMLDKAGIRYDAHVESGPVAETIVKLAKRWKCDVIVMGTRGAGSTPNLILGSVAMKVVQLSPCAITLVN